MTVVFTGTRHGMSIRQRVQLGKTLSLLRGYRLATECAFHHGAAVGADEQAGKIASLASFVIVEHPAAGNPLRRNREMVAMADIVVAAPASDAEELRSGTWATIRYARKACVPVVMLAR